MTTITRPPLFRAAAWTGENYPVAPYGYDGIRFDFRVIEWDIRPVDDDNVWITGIILPAANVQFATPVCDPDYPIYFEVTGLRYHYVFSIWSDRVEIEVCTQGPDFRPQSCMFPVTREQFIEAVATVVDDCLLLKLLRRG